MTGGPVRIAIVGLDHWYTAIPLAQGIAAHPDTELVGIADAELARAQEVAGQIGDLDVTDSFAKYIEDSSVDVIAAFASSDRNPETCIAAAEQGKHIVSIKPFANTLDEAAPVVEAVRRAGVRFLPAECRGRAASWHQQLKTWVDEGKFGTPRTASFAMWGGLPTGWPGKEGSGWWVEGNRAPGGGWIDHSIYHIDLLRWLYGASVTKVSGVAANVAHKDLPVEDYGHAIVEFDNGLIATIEDTWHSSPGGSRMATSIIGSDASVATDSLTGKVSLSGTLTPFDRWTQIPATATHPDGLDDIIAFGRGDSLATVEDAWHNLAVCQAFYEAANAGTTVTPRPLP